MSFLKNMMGGNRQGRENVRPDDVAAIVEDESVNGGPEAQDISKLAAIQSRIKATQSRTSKQDDTGDENPADSPGISDFADVVRKIRTPAPTGPENSTRLAPVMTEEDFSNLDDELARMSDELEEQEATQVDTNTRAPQVQVARSVRPQAPVRSAPPTASVAPKPEVAKDSEATRAPLVAKQPVAQTIVISEKQGGASLPAAMPQTPPRAQVRKEPVETLRAETTVAPSEKMVEVPAPAAGRSGRRAGRVKTRLLGFEHSNGKTTDPFSAEKDTTAGQVVDFPVGWIIVVDGPGRGAAFALFNGVSQIGRGEDQSIRLDFGDTSISRNNHAAIAYDAEQNKFFLGHGGKANLVRLNANPVLSTEEIKSADIIRIGETKLRFIALCGDDFSWVDKGKEDEIDAAPT